jgi:BASS family bile acid:Na+ symporter
MDIDSLAINFNPAAQNLLQFVLAFVMFSIAIDTPMGDFKTILQRPKGLLVGAIGQFLLFPAFTFLLVSFLLWSGWVTLSASMILGMYLIAACPGGNISNFLSHLAGGNTALSVSLSALSTLAAVVSTPLNFGLWAGLTPAAATAMQSVSISFMDLASSVILLLVLPMLVGLAFQFYLSKLTLAIKKTVKILAALLFIGLIVGALAANWANFMQYIHYVVFIVIIQNSLGLIMGYFWARTCGLQRRDARTISIEIGIQNSGLALLLALQFFPKLGGMALIAAWWSVWHGISGGILAAYWQRNPVKITTNSATMFDKT